MIGQMPGMAAPGIIALFRGASAGLEAQVPVQTLSARRASGRPAWEWAWTKRRPLARSLHPCCVVHGGKPSRHLAHCQALEQAHRCQAELHGHRPILAASAAGCSPLAHLWSMQQQAGHASARSPKPATTPRSKACTTSFHQPYTEINNMANYRTAPTNGQSPKIVNMYYVHSERYRPFAVISACHERREWPRAGWPNQSRPRPPGSTDQKKIWKWFKFTCYNRRLSGCSSAG